jgi:hypothetical protein
MMSKKTVWHTDIVVNGQGLGLKIAPERNGCYRVELKPDAPGPAATRAKKKFMKAVNAQQTSCSAAGVKDQVERAIIKSLTRWNKWHKEAY